MADFSLVENEAETASSSYRACMRLSEWVETFPHFIHKFNDMLVSDLEEEKREVEEDDYKRNIEKN